MILHEPIQHGIGHRRVADPLVPVHDGQLACDDVLQQLAGQLGTLAIEHLPANDLAAEQVLEQVQVKVLAAHLGRQIRNDAPMSSRTCSVFQISEDKGVQFANDVALEAAVDFLF